MNGKKTILIVENDHDTRVSLRQVLEAEGHFVFSAADGINGLALLRRIKPPSLILLDLMMPMMDGEEFLQALDLDPELHLIPVIVVSAFPEMAKSTLARAFLQKPVDLQALLTAVARHPTCTPPSRSSPDTSEPLVK